MKKAFSSFDKDNSGFINASEINQEGKALGEKISDDDINAMMKQLDSNKDIKIALEK